MPRGNLSFDLFDGLFERCLHHLLLELLSGSRLLIGGLLRRKRPRHLRDLGILPRRNRAKLLLRWLLWGNVWSHMFGWAAQLRWVVCRRQLQHLPLRCLLSFLLGGSVLHFGILCFSTP
jgi:hypothetical protein